MHHPEENLSSDVSSTLAYRRDSFLDFARYWLRFFFSYGEMAEYFRRTKRTRLLKRFVIGESLYALVLLCALVLRFEAALVVFVVPLLVGRSVLIIGNWAEHAFVDPAAPENPFRASLNLIGKRINERCFNVGYHIGHHRKVRMHFSDMAREFEEHLEDYGREDAIVLRDMHYPDVWFHLMIGNYARLARSFVQLPGAPERTPEQVISLMRSRVVPIHHAG
jgi:fatty acid desaturase